MFKLTYSFFVLLSFFGTINLCNAQESEKKIFIRLLSGYEQQNLHWSIAGNSNGTTPNVLSELKWKNIRSIAFGTDITWNIWKQVTILSSYERAETINGVVNDMDYAGDNRTNPTYQGDFSSNKGFSDALSFGIGYKLFQKKRFVLSPAIGYGFSRQSLFITDQQNQSLGLNSTYATNLKGVFAKLTALLRINDRIKLSEDLTYNQVNYSGTGDWNLIEEFQHPVSYTHTAKGYGLNTNTSLSYSFIPNFAVCISQSFFDWETGHGIDELYLKTGMIDNTLLNGVIRTGFRSTVGVEFRF